MSRPHVSRELRRKVAIQSRHRCGYCLTAEAIFGLPMEVDHIIPTSQGGLTIEENLWLACAPCNDAKRDRVVALDIETGELVRLFDPRRQKWKEHFQWNSVGDHIIGVSPTGRATIRVLDLNRVRIVAARSLWISAGWHPPKD